MWELIFLMVILKIPIAYLCLVVYWAVKAEPQPEGGDGVLVPVPGHGAGHLTPDGNLAAYVDHVVLGSRVAATGTNPEGLLSTFPALVTVLIGYWGGQWLRTRPLSSAT